MRGDRWSIVVARRLLSRCSGGHNSSSPSGIVRLRPVWINNDFPSFTHSATAPANGVLSCKFVTMARVSSPTPTPAPTRLSDLPPFDEIVRTLQDTPTGQLDSDTIFSASGYIKLLTSKTPTSKHDVEKADRLLRRLISEATTRTNSALEGGIKSGLINRVLQGYRDLSSRAAFDAARLRQSPDSSFAKSADDLLEFVEAKSEEQLNDAHGGSGMDNSSLPQCNWLAPGTDSYSLVIDAFAKAGKVAKAEDVLMRVEPQWLLDGDGQKHDSLAHFQDDGIRDDNYNGNTFSTARKCRPSAMIYQAVLNAYANSKEPGSAQKAEQILHKMELLYRRGYDKLRPRTVSYNTVIASWAYSADPGAAERAEAIIYHMLALPQDINPDTRSFNTALYAWATSGLKEAPSRAESLLKRMEDLRVRGVIEGPNTISYNNLLHVHAQSGDNAAPKRTEAILGHMLKMVEKDGRYSVQPNAVTFNSVINAWAKSGQKGAAHRASAVLEQMEDLCSRGRKEICPDTVTYSTVIDCWAKSGERGAAQNALALLEKMEQLQLGDRCNISPNTITYTTVISALGRSREKGAAQRAELLLKRMEAMHEQGNTNVKPNLITWIAVIDAYSKSRWKGAAKRAEEILERMIRSSEQGRKDLQPNVTCFTAVIDAYAASYEIGATRKAEELLQRMQKLCDDGHSECRPNRVTYNAMIKNLARSREKGAAQKAENILKRMLILSKGDRNSDVFPDTISFSTSIDAWAKSKRKDAFEHAKRLFDQMDALGLNPNAITYNALMNSLAISDRPNKAVEAQRTLEEIRRKGIAADCLSYNAVLRACARTEGDEQQLRRALKIAMEIMEEFHSPSSRVQPSFHTYDMFFVICAKASQGEEYEKLVSLAFRFCCKRGLLQDTTIKNLARTAPKHFFEKLVGSRLRHVTTDALNPKWSKCTNRHVGLGEIHV